MCLSCLQEEEGGGEQKKEQFFHEIGFENWGFKGEEGKEKRRKSGIYGKVSITPPKIGPLVSCLLGWFQLSLKTFCACWEGPKNEGDLFRLFSDFSKTQKSTKCQLSVRKLKIYTFLDPAKVENSTWYTRRSLFQISPKSDPKIVQKSAKSQLSLGKRIRGQIHKIFPWILSKF